MTINEKNIVQQAFDLYAKNEVDKSLELLGQAVLEAKELGNQLSLARITGKKAVILLESGQFKAAKQALEEVMALAEEMGNLELKAGALSNLGLVSAGEGDPGTCLLKQQEATLIARQTEKPHQVMTHLGLLGHAYIELANFEEAGKAYIEAMQIAREIEDANSQRGFLNNLGVIFAYLDQHENAVKAFSELSELAVSSEDYVLALNAEKNLVKHAIAMGEIKAVVTHSSKGLELIDMHNLGESERSSFEEMLILGLMSNNNHQEAKDKLKEIIKEAEEKENKDKLLKTLGQLADANFALGNLPAAEKEYQRALDLSVRLQEKPVEARILSRLGALYADLDDFEKSNEALLSGLKISNSLGDQEIIGEQNYFLALNFRENGNIKKAKEHARRSVEANLASGTEYRSEKARVLLESLETN